MREFTRTKKLYFNEIINLNFQNLRIGTKNKQSSCSIVTYRHDQLENVN